MQHIGTLDEAFAWLDQVGGTLTMSTNSVECRAPGAWHCVRAESVEKRITGIALVRISVHQQVMTRKHAAVNRRRGHGAKASHEWAKKGE